MALGLPNLLQPVLLGTSMPSAGVGEWAGGKEGSREEPVGVCGFSGEQADTGYKCSPSPTPCTRVSLNLESEDESCLPSS